MSTTSPPVVLTGADVFGPMVSLADVEDAVLALLQNQFYGLPFYVAEIERLHDLTPGTLPLPPSAVSYRGGIDFQTFENDVAPLVIAVVQPVGEPERYGGQEYGQWFEIQVGSITSSEDSQDEARRQAQYYGTAVAACIVQHGSLGKLANNTWMTAHPRVEFPDPNRRSLCQSVATFRTNIQPIFIASFGPHAPYYKPLQPGQTFDPYDQPGQYPTVRETEVDVLGVPLTETPEEGIANFEASEAFVQEEAEEGGS